MQIVALDVLNMITVTHQLKWPRGTCVALLKHYLHSIKMTEGSDKKRCLDRFVLTDGSFSDGRAGMGVVIRNSVCEVPMSS